MPITPSFAIIPSNSPSLVILSDTSTGSDVTLTSRTVYIYQSDGTLFVPAVTWAIADSSITLDILSSDEALNIRVDWATTIPAAYTYSKINAFVKYGQQFIYSQTQAQTANPSIAQDQNFYQNKLQLLCEVLSAQNAIDTGGDQFAASLCIARGTYLIQNSNMFF